MKSTEPKKTPDPFCIIVGQVLREARERMRLRLEGAAERAGISRQTVQFVESATHDARVSTLRRMAQGQGLRLSRVIAEAEERMERQG
ncbi:MAG: hypothetical protein RL088_1275 [Verrucomicrobiota bacterium]|jgi:predicted transcriptional regulator